MAVAVAVAPCGAPPCAGTQGGSTFAKLGLLPEPTHTAPNPQENSCRQPKTMLIKYAAKSPRTLQPLRLLDHGLPPRQIPRILAQNSPSPRAHTRKSSLSNLQPHPRPAPTPSWQRWESPPPGAAQVLSLVFIPTHPKSARRSPPQNQTPCLSNLLSVAQAKAHAKFRATRIRVSRENGYSRRKRPQSRAPNPRSGLNQPQPNPQRSTALLKRPRAGYPTMDAQPVGWESGGHQAHGRSATYPGFG